MNPPKVLALDCDSDALIRLEQALENAGFSTTTTWHVPEAIALLKDSSFEVFLFRRHPQIDVEVIQQQCGGNPNCTFVELDTLHDHQSILHLLNRQH